MDFALEFRRLKINQADKYDTQRSFMLRYPQLDFFNFLYKSTPFVFEKFDAAYASTG